MQIAPLFHSFVLVAFLGKSLLRNETEDTFQKLKIKGASNSKQFAYLDFAKLNNINYLNKQMFSITNANAIPSGHKMQASCLPEGKRNQGAYSFHFFVF